MRRKNIGKIALLLGALLLILALTAAAFLGAQADKTLRLALDGRRPQRSETRTTFFSLREQMFMEQAATKVRGWRAMAQAEEVFLTTRRGRLSAQLFSPIGDQADAPWALALHGGLGSDHTQVLDVACMLSLAGYRVLTPDLHAHGRSEGEIASLGLADIEDVRAWIDWIMLEDEDARIVLFGQDEGAVAALMAAGEGLPKCVAALAADSAYVSVQARAHEMLANTDASALGKYLLDPAYCVAHGISLEAGDVTRAASKIDMPLLVIHGTGDAEVLAWQGEDIAGAAGEHARLLLVEGAAHGMARYLEPQVYQQALLDFYGAALE